MWAGKKKEGLRRYSQLKEIQPNYEYKDYASKIKIIKNNNKKKKKRKHEGELNQKVTKYNALWIKNIHFYVL